MSQRNRKKNRVAIVMAAAARCGCTIMEIYTRAQQGIRKVVMNLDKIPERVIRYARRILRQHFTDRAAKKRRQEYFRSAPFMRAC